MGIENELVLVGQVYAAQPLTAGWSAGTGTLELDAGMASGPWAKVRESARGLAALLAATCGIPVAQFVLREGAFARGEALWARTGIWVEALLAEKVKALALNKIDAAIVEMGDNDLWDIAAGKEQSASRKAAQAARAFFDSGDKKLTKLVVQDREFQLPAKLGPNQPPSKQSLERKMLGVIVGYHREKRVVFVKEVSRDVSAWELGAEEEVMLPKAIEAAEDYPRQVAITYRELTKEGHVVARELLSLTPQQALF